MFIGNNNREPPSPATLFFTRAAFRRLGLPLPEQRHVLRTYDNSGLAFATPFGCVLRLSRTWQTLLRPDSTHILKPIGAIRNPFFTLEIFPGILCADAFGPEIVPAEPSGTADCMSLEKLKKRLKTEGINFFDAAERNVGYLPDSQGNIRLDDYVVLDMDAVIHFNAATAAVKKLISPPYKQTLTGQQDGTYKPLRELFKKAVQGNASMIDFWRGCHDARKQGILIPSWKNSPHLRITIAAERYESKLKTHAPLLPILEVAP